ncbi:MAG: hypothetical protein OXI11_03520, partial [Gammaproteobacteria bacterium]|nr:hypothetical protein [Gammaproteobacteria bacterium]
MAAAVMLPLASAHANTVYEYGKLSVSPSKISEEGGTATLTLSRNAQARPNSELTFDLDFSGGSATVGTDFTISGGGMTLSHPYTIVLGAGDKSVTFTISAISDSVDDVLETVRIKGSKTYRWGGGGSSTIPEDTVTFTTNVVTLDIAEPPKVSFVASDYEAKEGGSAATVKVQMTGNLTGSVVIPVVASGRGGAGAGDYSVSATGLTFGRNSLTQTLTVTANDDMVDDDGESVALRFGTLPSGVIAKSPTTETVTLVDNDVSSTSVQLSVSRASISEGAGPTTFKATGTLNASSRTTATRVTFSVGGDSEVLTIPAESKSGSVEVTFKPASDNVDAPDLKIDVTGSTSVSGLSVSGTSFTVRDDDDPPDVSLTLRPSTIEEGDSATVTASLNRPSSEVTTVRITAPGVTVNGSPLKIPAGKTRSGSVTLQSSENDDYEADREVEVSGRAINPQGIAGDPASVTLTIKDDDDPPLPELSLSSSSYSVGEGGGSVTVNMRLSDSSSSAVTVKYATEDGTARAGSDYTRTTGTLRISAGDTRGSFDVPITSDTLDEPNETFKVRLRSPSNATLGRRSQATVTITDDDDPPKVSFSSSSETVGEGAGSVSLTVDLSAASGKTVKVKYATQDGSAESGSDYTSVSGTLTFSPGDEEKTISVPVTDDSIDEPGETFTVSLSNPSNAALGSPSSSTVTIQDNDVPDVTVSYVSADYKATEGGSSATVTVNLSAAPQRQVTIPIASSAGGGATAQGQAGADYSGIPASVTFGKTDTSKTFTVTAAD